MSKYIFSTLTADQNYTLYARGGGDLPVVAGEVFVKGGANIPDKRLVTPHGVATAVTDEQLEMLEANTIFQTHKTNGFITVGAKKADPDVVATDMETRSPDAPLVDQDFTNPAEATPAGAREPEPTQTVAAQARPANPKRA